jgi:molybdopterin-binding protein
VKNVERGNIMAEVVVDIGGQQMVSVITKNSVDRLRLVIGDPVTVIIKSTR